MTTTTHWDERGVPTITADSDESVCRELGRTQAVAHARTVLELYGVARGDAAGRWGRDFLAGDLEHAQLLLDDQVDQWCDAQLPQTWARLEAFCAGFNEALADDPELGAGRRDVLPVVPRDIIAHSIKLFLVFARFWDDGKAFPTAPGGLLGGGSNGFAVAGERTDTGEALLVINPHIPWFGPFRLFEVRTTSPGRSLHGIVTLGLPWQVMGYGPTVGWTHTVNPIPAQWVYALVADDDTYLLDGVSVPFVTRRHRLRVRGEDDVTVVSRRTVHGPVVTAPDGVDVAVRIAGVLHQPAYFALEGWWQMSRSATVQDLLDAQDRFPLPTYNIITADAAGSVAAAFCGSVPNRPGGTFEDSRRRLPGDSSSELWHDTLPPRSLPRVVNPASGWVQNVNDAPWWFTEPPLDPDRYADGIAPRPDQLRDVRSPAARRFLRGRSTIGAADLLQLKWQTHLHLADVVLDDLLRACTPHHDLAAACAVLARWDRTADAGSAGYPLFHLWANGMFDTAGLLLDPAQLLPARVAGDLPRGLADLDAAPHSLRRAVRSLQDEGHAPGVTLGEFARIPAAPGSEPAVGGPTFFGAFKCLEYSPEPGNRLAIGGDSWVSLVRFTRDGAWAEGALLYDNATEAGAAIPGVGVAAYVADQLLPIPFLASE